MFELSPPAGYRAQLMRNVRRRHTAPEVALRRLLFAYGYRFRLHAHYLPGHPDIVLPKHKAAIFVHGCFWHGHSCRHGRQVSKSNTEFWLRKIHDNRKRDARKIASVRMLGWRAFVIWECEIKSGRALSKVIRSLRQGELAVEQRPSARAPVAFRKKAAAIGKP